ncbi:hypothetical protein EUGRSUZ_A00477 [Eucalyptus grandis]|uniref:Uncharacterized protein n=2 Tax=Eucalyptus grandis TaxID=71139 RepID=A0ACC3KHD8_EUCGR|nr:hypothetical protein EUGRSUZ_A00477 [Eucalyptus grandis]
MMNELDKISKLPGHIMDQILSRLPIKDAVRTSILSRKWRYRWSSVPQLVFDDQCTSTGGVPIETIIDKVLLLHTGPIQKFMLSHQGMCASSDIDHWILHLCRVSVNEIILNIWEGQYYKIPTSLFNCQDLIHLELYRCLVKIPSTFEGFKILESLDLQVVELSPDELEALISRCPLLKRLTLRGLDGIKQINVEVGNLEWLEVEGALQDVAFGVMNRLKSVRIDFSDDIDFNSTEEILTVMCLIRSSPKLKQLDFRNRAKDQQTSTIGTMADFWEDHRASCLEQVQFISMDGFSGSEPELEFIKFLLTSSPNLQEMTIQPESTSGEGKLLRELLRSRRASTQAEVFFI